MGSFQQEGKRSFCSIPKTHKPDGSRDLGTVCFKGSSRGCILPPAPSAWRAHLPSAARLSALILFYFTLAGACLSICRGCPCQPASCEPHGELAESGSFLPNLSANEEASAWAGCGAGSLEPPVVASCSRPSPALSGAERGQRGQGLGAVSAGSKVLPGNLVLGSRASAGNRSALTQSRALVD